MNWEDKIEMLAARARAEQPPHVNVAPEVLRILTSGQADPLTVGERFWLWLAAGASALAVPAAAFAISVYNAGAGPLREVMNSISWAI
jgi:hypothetical protein